MNNHFGNESRIQILVNRMLDEAASGKGYGLSAIGTGLLIVFLRAVAVLLVFCRLVVWLCRTKQWVRLALTMGWFAGVYAAIEIAPSPNGSVWHVAAWFGGFAVWMLIGFKMNDSALRESNGFPPRVEKRHA